MRLPWLERRDETWAHRLALLPLDLVALGYGAGAMLHRAAYGRGWLPRRRLSCRVVSVGGLLVGGSGKTPLAAWVAARLHARGHKVALASRGYGRAGREPVLVVSDGRHVRSDAVEAGDEPMLLAAHAPGVPVLVGRDRGVVGLRAISAFGADVVVLDDGFHHHRLARDVEIVAFDGAFGLGNRRVLPRGPLREPLRALRRAHAVAVLDGPLPEADEAVVAARAPDALRVRARRVPAGLRPLAGGPLAPVDALRGADVGLVAGIARPASLRRTLEQLGARVVAERTFPDHHRYRRGDLRGLRDRPGAPAFWVTTEKDAGKIVPGWLAGVDLRVLRVQLAVDDDEGVVDWLEARLRHPRERPRPRAAQPGAGPDER